MTMPPMFMQKVFDVAEQEREANIHHNRQLNDFTRRFELAKRVPGHGPILAHCLKLIFR